MNYIDIIVLIFVILAVIKGFSKGFIIGVTSLAGLILGIIFSLKYGMIFGRHLEVLLDNHSNFIHIAAYLICFVLVAVIVHVIGKSIEKVVEIAALGFANRLAGAALGILKALFVFSAIFYLLNLADPHGRFIKPETRQNSFFFEHLEYLLPSMLPFLKTQLEKVNEAFDNRQEVAG